MKRSKTLSIVGHGDAESSRGHSLARTAWVLSALFCATWVAPALADEPVAKDLRLFYQQNCAGCHGVDGAALGADGKNLKGPDLTDAAWRKKTKDEDMVKTIMKGRFFGLAMPAFKDKLTNDEAELLVTDVIRKAEKGKAITAEVATPTEK
ncbi:MAG: cytochrome c [bacterium]